MNFRDRIGIIAVSGNRIAKSLNQPSQLGLASEAGLVQANYKAIEASVKRDIHDIEYQLKLLQQTSD